MRKVWIVLMGVLIGGFVMGCGNNIAKNEAAAKATVRYISTALEVYASSHGGQYPTTGDEVTQYFANFEAYNSKTVNGYYYGVNLFPNEYGIIAAPSVCGTTGTKMFTVMPGGNIVEAECVRKN